MPERTLSDAVVSPTLPTKLTEIPPDDHRRKPWLTSSGLWIGGAISGKPLPASDDATRIQSALLRFPTTREGQVVSIIETDSSLRARCSRLLRGFTSRLRTF